MPRLTATTTPDDERRATRLMVAWATGDRLAADVVLQEVMEHPTGTPGLVFALTEYATSFAQQLAPEDYVNQLRSVLLHDDEEDQP